MTDNIEFWNQRAALGATSGTQDLIAVELERRAIEKHVKDGMKILDVGCGDGQTAIRLARQHDIHILGIDYAEDMVTQANQKSMAEPEQSRTRFFRGDIADSGWGKNTIVYCGLGDDYCSSFQPPYDLALTQRCIINLPDWATQRKAIENIIALLKPGGMFLMVECLQDGLDEINHLRSLISLPVIVPPWHCRYLQMSEIRELAHDCARDVFMSIEHYSGLYYLLSRIVNAGQAASMGEEPSYESSINTMALQLPASVCRLRGQGVMVRWCKRMYPK